MRASREWFRKAIVYEITPNIFVRNGQYKDILDKLPELAKLGVNTIWLQPVFKSHRGGQGYDVVDYLSLRPELGTEDELRSLVQEGKRLRLRVLLDFVANHTSIHHPYAKDVAERKEQSDYYDFYQHADDKAPYGVHYRQTDHGFYTYFWKDLVNLNVNNERVQKWLIDACKHWVRRLDIDGYRFDASWGFNSRNPQFTVRLVKELKSLKSSIFLLAEDKGSTEDPYKAGFDAAYDWAAGKEWVSQWSWEKDFSRDNSMTIFNVPSLAERRSLLRDALFSGYQRGLRLRYLENNDLHRFIENHSMPVLYMAAAMMFTLPGIPMIYNGQEIGFRIFAYGSRPIFNREASIESVSPILFEFYRRLIAIRLRYPSLTGDYFREVPVSDADGCLAYHRKYRRENIVVVINLDGRAAKPVLNFSGVLPRGRQRPVFTDLLTGELIAGNTSQSEDAKQISVAGSSTRILLLHR